MFKLTNLLFVFLCGSIKSDLVPGYKKGIPMCNWYYKFHTTPKTWGEAKLVCESENAHLAVINSDREAQLYVKEFAKYPFKVIDSYMNNGAPLWHRNVAMVGFHDQFVHGHYETIFGTSLEDTGYLRWDDDEPNNINGVQHCGSIYRNGKLNNIPCHIPFTFFCESTYPFIGEEPIQEELKCETYELGYKLGASVGDRFYKLHQEKMTWDMAALVCQSEKAKLAVINSDEEARIFVNELLNVGDNANAYIGIHDRIKEGHFITLDGTPINETGYNKWAKGQPDNYNNIEHCVDLNVYGHFNDISCDYYFMFFCEKPFISDDISEICRSLSMSPYITSENIPDRI